ncbi:exonuclease VII small subunit [Candidatus Pelagibacter sp.]|nr:exonuclease VII small subunit [Candidatus Pelagibacter sp.]
MNEKNLPDDINSKTLNELTEIANKIIQNLENQKNLEESLDEYQKLIRLNNLIEKKFQKSSKEISESAKFKINKISIKNAKKIK